MPCEIISSSESDLTRAACSLSEGKLVALPTETVYGLGGNVWMPQAVKNIFLVKSRPSSDPLICHVDALEKGLKLWAGGNEGDKNYTELKAAVELATFIGSAFWPGPLTIVSRASSSLPSEVTGGSGYVGLRIPSHPIALALLRLVDFAVAAPSANTFGHVSPISAFHVFDDLASRDPTLLIIDGGKCNVGIESTVIKIADNAGCIEMLRRGKVTVTDIKKVLSTHPTYKQVSVEIRDTRSKKPVLEVAKKAFTATRTDETTCIRQKNDEQSAPLQSTVKNGYPTCHPPELHQPMDGPGQLLTHYSPCIAASLLAPGSFVARQAKVGQTHDPTTIKIVQEGGAKLEQENDMQPIGIFALSSTVVIDFYGVLLRAFDSTFLDAGCNSQAYEGRIPFYELRKDDEKKESDNACNHSPPGASVALGATKSQTLVDQCLAYIDLSSSGDIDEASANLFDALRWSEKIPGANNVVFPLLSAWFTRAMQPGASNDSYHNRMPCKWQDEANWSEFLDAVDDRLFRAASGRVALVK